MDNNQTPELINQLISLHQLKEDLWVYHPANKNKRDIVKDYFKLTQDIESIEKQMG